MKAIGEQQESKASQATLDNANRLQVLILSLGQRTTFHKTLVPDDLLQRKKDSIVN